MRGSARNSGGTEGGKLPLPPPTLLSMPSSRVWPLTSVRACVSKPSRLASPLTATEMWDSMPAERREAMLKGFGSTLPLGRAGESADVGEAIAFLLSASYITGTVLDVDGGAAIRHPQVNVSVLCRMSRSLCFTLAPMYASYVGRIACCVACLSV